MSDQPRHRFFQIHLSTAFTLMFVAGGLLWANMPHSTNDPHGTVEEPFIYKIWEQGWPLSFRITSEFYYFQNVNVARMVWNSSLKTSAGESWYHWPELVIDVLLWIGIFVGTAMFLERATRIGTEREARIRSEALKP